MPEEVLIVQDHPNKKIENRQIEAENWFDTIKLAQVKYLQS